MSQSTANFSLPLCVDLDGTLVRTDTLHEHLIAATSQSTIKTLLSFKYLLAGKAKFKAELAKIRSLPADNLPVNDHVIEFISSQPTEREKVLVTGATTTTASAVAEKTGLFSSVMASDDLTNLTGEKKRQKLVEKYGEKGFDYIGNDYVDWPVFESANQGYIVSNDQKLIDDTTAQYSHIATIEQEKSTAKDWMKLLRVHHWAKNLLVFIPLLLEHRIFDIQLIIQSVLCFLAFSLLASATYILNDLHDIHADRQNTTKCKRPLASGAISIAAGIKTCALLLVLLAILLFFLGSSLIAVLAFYLVATLSYTLFIKQILFLDVVTLACLQTLRIIAGIVAINALWSFWVLSFSMFFFLSLALAKRVTELKNLDKENRTESVGRGYEVGDISILMPAGVSAGNISVLIVALYINSEKVIKMYFVPEFLWGLCPLLVYWLGRIWIVTARGYMTEDPLVYALKDKISILIAFAFAACVLLASPM